ncbi:MAG TPA: anti-sigma factor [Chloroflexota bacterium]|jgi:hypothetical protein|nr:anti-sigma factor [Chloroflexota bacterium]
MDEKHCVDLLAGYAIDALDGDDRLTAELHILKCPECRAECAELRETLHYYLGHALPPVKPGPLVRTQFLAHIALEMNPTQPEPARGWPVPPFLAGDQTTKSRKAFMSGKLRIAVPQPYRWLLGGAALPAVLAIVLGMLFMHTQGQLDDTRSHLLSDLLVVPHVTMPMSGVAVSYGMRGEVIMPRHGSSGLLVVSGMTTVPSGMSYTCWIREQGHWLASGTLRPTASGIVMMAFDRNMDLHAAEDVAVTMEHSQRPAAPSGPMLLSSSL